MRIFFAPAMALLLLCPNVHGQISTAALLTDKFSAPIPQGDFLSMSLSIKRAGNLVLVEAMVDSVVGHFILDTGAPCLVLNSSYFNGYEADVETVSRDVNGKRENIKAIRVGEFSLGGLHYNGITAHLADLSEVENLRGTKILGALGLNLFLQLELELNLNDKVLRLHRLDYKGDRFERLSTSPVPADCSVPFEIANDIMLVRGSIGRQKLKFCFDTGAEAVVLDNKLKTSVYSSVELENFTKLTGANGSVVGVHIGRLKRLKIGCVLDDVLVVVTDLKGLERTYHDPIDGLVGYVLLSMGTVNINFVKRTIQLRKNRTSEKEAADIKG